ncbi:electron transfer flavoprotein beta subunit/FixA family protein [Occultella glacieicola]|uniref:Electron transfer flavoprotein subunit beta n=1 Tax=Occultella glacieicola TaxID=2518684 RepID=A0ABY2E5X1_9MICO|nr:electron transfer flavoprotein subunit beta/FixA family protein [Occultella glacieicola]TDE95988.1 electron transfer flavoprotein beta subunit/FixA family protein [Occultella glacieicola]
MRIVVCVKHVPDLQSTRGFTAEHRVVRSADDGTMNEVDENAVEAALALVAAAGDGEHEIIALTLGPDVAADAVRRALQMGADRGIRITDDALAGADYFGTATALAAAIRRIGDVDVVLTGMAALDGLGAVVPSLLAAALDLPQLTVVQELTYSDGALIARRELDGVTETLRATLPAVVAVTDLANTPRLPKFKEIMAARAKEIEVLGAADLGLADGASTNRTEVLRTDPRPPRPEPEIVTDSDSSGGRALADYLISNDLI